MIRWEPYTGTEHLYRLMVSAALWGTTCQAMWQIYAG